MNYDRKKRILLGVLLVSTVVLTIAGTFAYIETQTSKNEEEIVTIKSGALSLKFSDKTNGFNKAIVLGKSVEKEFTIENAGTERLTTNMLFDNLFNTYLEESLSYTLQFKTSETGEWMDVPTTHAFIPQSYLKDEYNLANNLTIEAGKTYYYKLTITFENQPDINQESDLSAIFNTKFKIGDAVTEPNVIEKIIAESKTENPDFKTIATKDEGIYKMQDDYGTSYYYRGAVTDNYVKFGKWADGTANAGKDMYWRIIRVNGDGSVRMIYDGTTPHKNGEASDDRFTHTNQLWNSIANDAKYAGWMYGGTKGEASTSKEETQANETSSDIKSVVDEWYRVNLLDGGYGKYIGDAGFCNDRSIPGKDKSGWFADTGLGYGKNVTAYGIFYRFISGTNLDSRKYLIAKDNPKPTLTCLQQNDLFTLKGSTKGNKALDYPVGLISADEVYLAGGSYYRGETLTENRDYYLYKGSWYWSMSPNDMDPNGNLYVFPVNTNFESHRLWIMGNGGGVAPVVNIAPEYAKKLVGLGTMNNPYQISDEN